MTGIGPDLTESSGNRWKPQTLSVNKGFCFQGPIPVGAGFLLSAEEAATLLADSSADYRQVVRPYLVGEDIANQPDQSPSRWTIDFAHRTLEEAGRFPAALAIVRDRVRPERDRNRDRRFREEWWRFGRPRHEMRTALNGRMRYLAGTATGKRLLLGWQEAWTCPSNLTNVFAFEDDYSASILLSRTHGSWAWAQSSTLKGDLRYTPSSVFMTFAWPDPVSAAQRDRVAEASRRLLARRSEICLAEGIGLTKLYNAVDEGAWADLKALHRELDVAVADCYGWPASVAQDDREIVRRLTELNQEISEGRRAYAPFDTD
ncbi:type IIL restriction-modification enzyme MmeI [Nocardioides sp.]|uniref:type IIL restriction-modification enzyme MmeI n=1 Tax=Nocardioides sp. TaxID=35761 RepID=UPI002EDAB35B